MQTTSVNVTCVDDGSTPGLSATVNLVGEHMELDVVVSGMPAREANHFAHLMGRMLLRVPKQPTQDRHELLDTALVG